MTDADSAWLQRVRYTAAEPSSWLSRAITLRQAAHDLWESGNAHAREPGSELGSTLLMKWTADGYTPPDTGGSTADVCFMIFGFALENLAKGIIVCRDPTVVKRKKLHTWHGNGHKLRALFVRAEIPLSEAETNLLERTTRITEWKGRYPVAMNFDEVGAEDRVLGHMAISNIWPADEYSGLSVLYDRAKAILQQTMEEIAPLPDDYDFG